VSHSGDATASTYVARKVSHTTSTQVRERLFAHI
jgi:hypothetical protein